MAPRWLTFARTYLTPLHILLAGMWLFFAVGAMHHQQRAVTLVNNIDTTTELPAWKHIFVIVLENKSIDQVFGNTQASYLNSLAQQYGRAAYSYGTRHPSLPNYLALLGGDTFGITSNCTDCTVNQPNLIDQLELAGISWTAYMEAMPSSCFLGDAPPLYRQKHNPFIYFDSIRSNPKRCNKIVPFTQFATDIQGTSMPNFVWITPNMCHNAHDCDLDVMDTWLHTWVPTILQSPAWRDNGVLFVTFDEGAVQDQSGCCEYAAGGRIVTLVIAPMGKPAYSSTVAYDHYSILRTIETAWGLPLLGKAACACTPPMSEFFVKP